MHLPYIKDIRPCSILECLIKCKIFSPSPILAEHFVFSIFKIMFVILSTYYMIYTHWLIIQKFCILFETWIYYSDTVYGKVKSFIYAINKESGIIWAAYTTVTTAKHSKFPEILLQRLWYFFRNFSLNIKRFDAVSITSFTVKMILWQNSEIKCYPQFENCISRFLLKILYSNFIAIQTLNYINT